MISCELMGGLGNQLFQIFATISYAIKYKQAFQFLKKDFLGKRTTYWNSFLLSLKEFTTLNLTKMQVIKETKFNYQELPVPNESVNTNTKLHGYFQSYKYFESSFDSICRLIQLDNQKTTIKYKYMHNFDNLISMHFRLGDYKSLQEYHPLLPFKYYKNSIKHIIDKTSNSKLKVLYFCEKEDNEDVQDIIELLHICYPDCRFIKGYDDAADWEQMLMMSICHHNIIANSTFSWWSAYFNTHEDKIVCYPDIWFGPKLIDVNNTCDLFPEKWNKISSE